MLFIFAKCDFSRLFFWFVSDIVFLRDMDVCDNEIPVTAVNELNNEMPLTAVNELPETSADDMENVQDRHVVNGELYASRAADCFLRVPATTTESSVFRKCYATAAKNCFFYTKQEHNGQVGL